MRTDGFFRNRSVPIQVEYYELDGYAVLTLDFAGLRAERRKPIMRHFLAFLAFTILAALSPGQAGMLTVTGNLGEVVVPDSAALVPATGLTVEAWFYFNQAAPGGVNAP